MTTIYNQNFESSSSLPAGFNADSGFSIDTTSALNGANSLVASTTGAKSFLYATQDGKAGNLTVSTAFKVASPGASSAIHLTARVTDSNPANYLTTASSYRAEITLGSAAASWRLVKLVAGVETAPTTSTSFVLSLSAATAYTAYLTTNGAGTSPGTSVSLEIQRVSDGLWLSTAATWVAARSRCMTWIDNSTPLAGQGYSGVRANLASGATLYADDFTLTDYADPTTYSKLWTDTTGWTTSGTATATANSFGSEAAVVLAGDTTTNSITSAFNDQQYGNVVTFNTQFKIATISSSVAIAGIKVRGYRFVLRGATNQIELQDQTATAVGTPIPWTYANWTNLRPYRLLGVCTATAMQFAVQDTVSGNYLQPGGTFAAGFTWAYNYTLTTPANPGATIQLLCNSNAAVSFGALTAGPAGTAIATPNPATVAAGGSVAIAPSLFDGVATTPSVTSGGGSYASGSYTAPGTAGSATLQFASTYHPAQTVSVPITITSVTVTTFTLTAPSPASGFVGSASGNFTVTPNAAYSGTVTITPSGGGLSTPIVLTFSASAIGQTFTITPTSAGTVTLTPTNNGGLANPSAVTYTANALLSTAYVAANGSDANAGTIGAPFLTNAQAMAATASGATINLRGGDTFTDQLLITAASGPRTVQSYGTGRATISRAGNCLSITDIAGVTITNIICACTNTTSPPIALVNTSAVTTRLTGGVTIAGCTFTGGGVGVQVTAASGAAGGWNGVTITNNSVSGATGTGIGFSESGNTGNFKHYSNVLIQGNTVFDISGSLATGSGIILSCVDSTTGTGAAQCVIRGNHVYHCGYSNASASGPGGVFGQYADGVLVESNLIHDISSSTAPSDGAAFDNDLSTSNWTFQRNVCYNLGGPGFLCFDSGGAGGHVVRWNVFYKCGQSNAAGLAGLRMYGTSGVTVHNNVFVMDPSSTVPAVFATSSGVTANKKVYNNTFISAPGVATVDVPGIDAAFLLEGNAYQMGDGTSFLCKINGTSYTSLAAFRTAASRETGHGFATTQPFVGYGSAYPTPTDPTTMLATVGTTFDPAGSLVAAGLNLQSLYSINPGTADLKGNAPTAPYAVGAVATATPANATGYTLALSPTSVAVGSPSTVTATLTGGTTLSTSLVITLADSLSSTISGTITIANGSTTGTATVTPTAVGSHAITATHTGGGFSGSDGSATLTATAANATGYTLAASPSSVATGSASVIVTATLTGGTTLSTGLQISLADDHASTIGGAISIFNGQTTGTTAVMPTATGTHAITATHLGGGFSGGDGSTTFTATAAAAASSSNFLPSNFLGATL